MINLSALLVYILTVIAYNGTPGPVIMLVTGTRLLHNFKLTVLTILGANLGSATLMLVAILVMFGVFKVNHNFLNIIIVLGCTYLTFVSVNAIIKTMKYYLQGKPQSKEIKTHIIKGGFKHGYSIGVSNPKDIIFFTAFFPQFINLTVSNTHSLIILSLIWIIFDWLILLSYATAVKKMISKSYELLFVLISNFFILIIAIMGLIQVFHAF